MQNHDETVRRMTENPSRARLTIVDEDGKEMRRPVAGLFAFEEDRSRFNVWQYHPEIPSGVDGGAAFHFIGGCLVEADQVTGSVVLRGTWTGIRRAVIRSGNSDTGQLGYIPGEHVPCCRVTLTPLPE